MEEQKRIYRYYDKINDKYVRLEVTDEELENGLNETSEQYGMTREEFEKQIGTKELFKYDLLMRKAMKVVTE